MVEVRRPAMGLSPRDDCLRRGVVAGSAVHGIDLVRWLGGRPRQTSVSAFLTRDLPALEFVDSALPRPVGRGCDNSVCAVVRFDGFSLLLDAEGMAGVTSVKHEVELVGEQARIHLVPFSNGLAQARTPSEKGVNNALSPDRLLSNSVAREWRALVETQPSAIAPVNSASDAFVVQAIVDAIYESAHTQHEIDVDLSELPDAFWDAKEPDGGPPVAR